MQTMAADAIRLLLFPALMAFAASSDLLTMTISNRLSIALAAGFFLLALVTGMELHAIGMHLAAAAVVLAVAFVFFSQGWIGGGDASSRRRLPCGLALLICSTICCTPRFLVAYSLWPCCNSASCPAGSPDSPALDHAPA